MSNVDQVTSRLLERYSSAAEGGVSETDSGDEEPLAKRPRFNPQTDKAQTVPQQTLVAAAEYKALRTSIDTSIAEVAEKHGFARSGRTVTLCGAAPTSSGCANLEAALTAALSQADINARVDSIVADVRAALVRHTDVGTAVRKFMAPLNAAAAEAEVGDLFASLSAAKRATAVELLRKLQNQ